MGKRTNKYGMVYFEQGDFTNAQYEMQRFETLDAQLSALFSIMGNGIIDGWEIAAIVNGGLSCAVLPGSGHVGFVACKSIDNSLISSLVPSVRNYIYAQLTADSYWTKNVNFVSFIDQLAADNDNNLYLGYVDTDTSGIVSSGINTTGRTELGFLALINNAVASHKHSGGLNQPTPINLRSEVQGILGQEHLPDLNADWIQSGTIDSDRLPKIDHITKLTNQGVLTHAQLDSYVETLSIENPSLMGEVSTTNLLQLILALKHVYPDIDEFLVNEISFIPGISPNDYIDTVNTTATVDTRTYAEGGQHTITGVTSSGFRAGTVTWDTQDDFDDGTLSNTIINGNHVILDTVTNELPIDEFNNINGWTISTEDLSSISSQLTLDSSTYVTSPSSGKLTISSEAVEVQLLIQKVFDAQDWSGYDYLIFYLYTANVQHGDLFFYLNDATFGEQNSQTKVLARNTPTVNTDTLVNGWQEISIDLRSFQRDNIDTLGFYVSTQEGWDTSKGLDLNIDSIKLTAGNIYEEDGYIRVVYGSSLSYNFWRLRWEATIPSDALSSGVNLQARTRVANNTTDLSTAPWSSYFSVSGTEITLPTESLYKYIEIEMYFTAASSLKRSALLGQIYLDYNVVDIENSFELDSKADWETGSRFNIDTSTIPGSIVIRGGEDVGDTIYGSQGSARQLNDSLEEVYGITGSYLPRSTNQVLSGEGPSLGLITAVARGNDGSIWMADTDNDRILEVNKAGNIIRGFQGSFISPPVDNYGVEDSGPGSNTGVVASTVAGNEFTLAILHSLYNLTDGILYVVFNKDLENIYSLDKVFDLNKMYIKVSGHKIWLNESNASLLGVDETGYNHWVDGASSSDENMEFLNQFKFTSHVLKITVTGADKTLLDYMVNQEQPSIVIYTPEEQERISGNVTVRFLIYNFVLGEGSGENGIKVTLDGVSSVIYTDRITYTGLAAGVHNVVAQLQNADTSLNTNIEATAEGSFVKFSGTYTQPYIHFTNPTPNQIYSSSPVSVSFLSENFPILPAGQHVKYQVDSESAVDYYSTDPIILEDLTPGEHTVAIWLVDAAGTALSYTYGSASVDFIVGLNSNAIAKFYIEANAIADSQGESLKVINTSIIDVENIRFMNIYAPIDVQMIPSETSDINDGSPTVLVSKLRSQSSTEYLGGSANVLEMTNRISIAAGENGITLNSVFDGIATPNLIYNTYYLDGHSVIQLNMDGDVIFSNNAAKFADDVATAKDRLGSGEKVGSSELLIGDASSKRAIIVNTDLTTQIPTIIWQYDSDRYVSDFHLNLQDETRISILNGSVAEALTYVRQGMSIIWTNNSSAPVSVYSGLTTYDLFQANSNLNLYGDVFSSTVLEPGDSYVFRFDTIGEYNWFVYPSIIVGKIQVTSQRLSSQDQYLILEGDGLESPFSSRLIRVDSWGNTVWSFGEGYLVKPRDARPMLNNRVLIST